jgi:N-acetylglucosamine kinase-like BadF-type ATPase
MDPATVDAAIMVGSKIGDWFLGSRGLSSEAELSRDAIAEERRQFDIRMKLALEEQTLERALEEDLRRMVAAQYKGSAQRHYAQFLNVSAHTTPYRNISLRLGEEQMGMPSTTPASDIYSSAELSDV